MRDTCLHCVEKHLAQAWVLISESLKDKDKYGWHLSIAIGHLAEAEDEAFYEEPDLSKSIRLLRTTISINRDQPNILADNAVTLLMSLKELSTKEVKP